MQTWLHRIAGLTCPLKAIARFHKKINNFQRPLSDINNNSANSWTPATKELPNNIARMIEIHNATLLLPAGQYLLFTE